MDAGPFRAGFDGPATRPDGPAAILDRDDARATARQVDRIPKNTALQKNPNCIRLSSLCWIVAASGMMIALRLAISKQGSRIIVGFDFCFIDALQLPSTM